MFLEMLQITFKFKKNSMILKGGVKNIGHDLISTCIDL